MTDRDELAVFDDDAVEAVAADHDVSADRLAELARTHQSNVRDLPGVDNIVYEWRRGLPWDPLLFRSPAVYVLALPDRVWAEFLDRLTADDAEADALRKLHDRQARRILGGADRPDPAEALDVHAAMVLTRP